MNQKHQTICVIGLGYIGLPTAALLASQGYDVVGVDINPDKVNSIRGGAAHFSEDDLDELLANAITNKKLRVKTGVESAEVFIIAVPTPINKDKTPDLTAVQSAFKSIAPHLKVGDLIILESTCPVGTTNKMAKLLASLRRDLRMPEDGTNAADVSIAYCPERVLPGQIIVELLRNDRVVGGISNKCTEKAIGFYRSFVTGNCFSTNSKTAEMCKLAENSFRDVNIAFANELSMICDHEGISVIDLIKFSNYHPRVNILEPGPGVGGHCIAIDPWFIINDYKKNSILIKAARNVNELKTEWVLEKIKTKIKLFAREKSNIPLVVVFGISYKANVNDLRESPGLKIVKELVKESVANILIVEPNIDECSYDLKKIGVEKISFEDAARLADICVILVGHSEFKIKLELLKNKEILNYANI